MRDLDVFPYRDREKASITVTTVEEPYGLGTPPVVSIGCTLKGDVENPSWKVHIPPDLLEDVAMALYRRSPSAMSRLALKDADERAQKRELRKRLDNELRAIQQMIDQRDLESGAD
jgi:hypothetical protein